MSSTTQTQEQRDVAYMTDTEQLLLDVLEANKIPPDIALAALWRAILTIEWCESKTVQELLAAMEALLNGFSRDVSRVMQCKMIDHYATLTNDQRAQSLIKMLKHGPASAIIKDGKVVAIEEPK